MSPFERVVDSVRAGVTGLAYLRNGATAFRALLTRVAFLKLYASLCDAIVKCDKLVMIVVETASTILRATDLPMPLENAPSQIDELLTRDR